MSSTISMASINDALIGIEKDYTVQAYIARDKSMNFNPNEQIIFSLSKLGYYNINLQYQINKFLNKKLFQLPIDSNKTIGEFYDDIMKTDEYKQFIDNVNKNIGRAFYLSKYIGSSDIEGFYNDLTLEELSCIGW
jgi:hypothetical protein